MKAVLEVVKVSDMDDVFTLSSTCPIEGDDVWS